MNILQNIRTPVFPFWRTQMIYVYVHTRKHIHTRAYTHSCHLFHKRLVCAPIQGRGVHTPSPDALIESATPRSIIRILIQSEFQELVCLVTCHVPSACHISADRSLNLIYFKQFHWMVVYKSFHNGPDIPRLR